MHQCTFPGCSYTTDKNSNLIRHKLTHLDEKVECECGSILTSAALDRHKKKSCVLAMKSNVQICVEKENVTIAKVQTIVQMHTQEDGSIQIKHGSITINGIPMVVIPEAALDSLNVNAQEEKNESVNIVDNNKNQLFAPNLSPAPIPETFEIVDESLFTSVIEEILAPHEDEHLQYTVTDQCT